MVDEAGQFSLANAVAVARGARSIFRGDRRHRRGAHHLDPGRAGLGAQLGLSLLLDARRLLRRARAQSHRRDANDGRLHLLYPHHRRRPRRDVAPLYGVVHTDSLEERNAPALAGYGGDGPVRIGNAAGAQDQHDVYGSIIMAATPMFFDRRLPRPGDEALFRRARAARRAGGEAGDGAGRRHLGISRQETRAHAFGGDVLVRLPAPGAPSPPISVSPIARLLGRHRRQNRRRSAATRLESETQCVFRRLRQRRSRRQFSAFGRTRPDCARRSAFRLHRGGNRA